MFLLEPLESLYKLLVHILWCLFWGLLIFQLAFVFRVNVLSSCGSMGSLSPSPSSSLGCLLSSSSNSLGNLFPSLVLLQHFLQPLNILNRLIVHNIEVHLCRSWEGVFSTLHRMGTVATLFAINLEICRELSAIGSNKRICRKKQKYIYIYRQDSPNEKKNSLDLSNGTK